MIEQFVEKRRWLGRLLLGLLLSSAGLVSGAAAKFQNFDLDPLWDGLRNRMAPNPGISVTENFGYRNTSNAGGAVGELGGTIARTTTPAWYADVISTPKTLNDVLIASGKISLAPGQITDSGLFFGWFNSARQGWRPWSSLDFRLDGQGSYSNIYIDYDTQTWHAGGTGTNTSYRIQHDGSQHTWQFSYDPGANSNNGALTFQLDSLTPIALNLNAGDKAQGAVFDRFGLWNHQSSPADVTAPYVSYFTAYFDNVQHDGGTVQTFSNSNTGWDAHGNAVSFFDKELRQAHNFGWSNTNYAGGAQPGEIGGTIWRPSAQRETYYAAKTGGTFTLNDHLSASGKVALRRANSDGGMYLGWFNQSSIENVSGSGSNVPIANFLAVEIEGPSRIGHYFRPVLGTASAARHDSDNGPVIMPDLQSHNFTIDYDPSANGGLGAVNVTLDSTTRQLQLTAADRAAGATFDHFGMFGFSPDGNYVEVYFDDLSFTAVPEPSVAMLILTGGFAVWSRKQR
jgi:hypothetical protein